MKWCKNCVLPDTRPNLILDDNGICNACRNHHSKSNIDWRHRLKELNNVVLNAQSHSSSYDCLIPVSGGKDSTWQTIKCLELGLKPLAVTWRPPGRTPIGQSNLDNLIRLGVDHIDYTINPAVEAKLMLKTFERFGSTGIPMHLALFNIPLNIASRFSIPLVIWGENSAFEYGNKESADIGFALDENWIRTYGVTHGTTAADWVDDELSEKDLTPYFGPGDNELQRGGVRAIFLGYYLPWDPETSRSLASLHGFEAQSNGPRTGYFNYADIDDDFISLHHWLKWYKFGFTRTFDNLSVEIRNGRLTRLESIEIIRELKDETPHKDIEQFCDFSDIEISTFMAIAEKFRNRNIWKQDTKGIWYIDNFLIKDWIWKS